MQACFFNAGDQELAFAKGAVIYQVVFFPVFTGAISSWRDGDELLTGPARTGGFGSTGWGRSDVVAALTAAGGASGQLAVEQPKRDAKEERAITINHTGRLILRHEDGDFARPGTPGGDTDDDDEELNEAVEAVGLGSYI